MGAQALLLVCLVDFCSWFFAALIARSSFLPNLPCHVLLCPAPCSL